MDFKYFKGIPNFIIKGDMPTQFPIDEILDKEERLVRGFVSVPEKDSQGDVMPLDELKRTMNTWMKRGAPITDEHSNRVVGKGLRWFVAKHPTTKNDAVAIDYQIHKDYSIDDEVWKQITSKDPEERRKGLSFGGRATEKPSMKKDGESGEMARHLKGLEGYEMATVKDPAVDLAFNTHINYLAKSKKKGDPNNEKKLIALDMFAKDYKDLTDQEKKDVEAKLKAVKEVMRNSEKLIDDFQKGYAVEDISKPFSGFENWDQCIAAQEERGHSEDSAKRICGFLQNRAEKSKVENVEKENKSINKTLYKIIKLPKGKGDVLEAEFPDGTRQMMRLSKEKSKLIKILLDNDAMANLDKSLKILNKINNPMLKKFNHILKNLSKIKKFK